MRPEDSKTELRVIEDSVNGSLNSIQGLLRHLDRWSRSSKLSLARAEILGSMKRVESSLLAVVQYLGDAIKVCDELDHAPVASIKRWLASPDGTIRQATLEECAMSEGLSIAEYLAKESEELAQAEEYEVEVPD